MLRNHCKKDFVSFGKHVWLNAASEGPLPRVAAAALQEAIEWKSRPYELTNEKFIQVPKGLKESIGLFIGVNPRDVILGNSASYGLHLLANGFPWQRGDEILLMQNDFPTDILPWLALEQKGVKVLQIKPNEKVLTPDELLANITEKTKLFCISQVHTFTGITVDVEQFAKICKAKGIIFVLNISQSAGTMPIHIARTSVDAVVAAGYKWLCGPYGTGFAWIKPELRDQLQLNQAYWIPLSTEEDLKNEGPLALRTLKTARKFDVFATANFFNFVPFKASIDYWLALGMENVQAYNQSLIDHMIQGLQGKPYQLISPQAGKTRSNLVVISHHDRTKNESIFRNLLSQGIYTAFWKGNIRIAPHVYNTIHDLTTLLTYLK